jgi:D-galactonate transporter
MALVSNDRSEFYKTGLRDLGPAEIEAVYKKVTLRIIPFIFVSYLFAFLDRINVGYAQLQMKDALGFSDTVYGFGAGIFFVSYLLFEVPSNLLLERIGVRLTLLRIMVLWGLASSATMLVSTPIQFYIVRFLLGLFEAGFFPGIILYLTYWFPSSRRGRVTSQFMFAVPVAGIIGGPLSGWIMSSTNGALGFGGWQWLFLCEGLPTSILGIACYFLLTDAPRQARWLTAREKEVVEATLAADQSDPTPSHANLAGELRRAFGDVRVWILSCIYFTSACAVYTFTFWLPTMIRNLGVTDVAQVGLYSFFPYVFAALGILGVGWSSDRQRERRWHLAGCMIMAALAFSLTTVLGSSLVLSLAVLCVAGFFNFGASVLYWSIPPTYLGKDAAAVGIAVISSLGVIGGFLSPTLLGLIRTYTGSLNAGIYFVAALLVAGALITLKALPSRALRVGGFAPTAEAPDALPS